MGHKEKHRQVDVTSLEIFQFLSKSMQSQVFIFENRHINKQASEIKRGEKDLGPTRDPRF